MKEIFYCPIHAEPLIKTPILWGTPDPNYDLSGYIIGGCVVEGNEPKYGYVCPVGECEIYIKDSGGKLVSWKPPYMER